LDSEKYIRQFVNLSAVHIRNHFSTVVCKLRVVFFFTGELNLLLHVLNIFMNIADTLIIPLPVAEFGSEVLEKSSIISFITYARVLTYLCVYVRRVFN